MRLSGLCLLVGLSGSATVYAGRIDLSTLLVNGNFQAGNLLPPPLTASVGCPLDWTCTTSGLAPGGTAYMPNGTSGSPTNPIVGFPGGVDITTQYVAGSDGLSSLGPLFVTPHGAVGTWAAQVPDHESNGEISQTNLGLYATGDSYAINLWVGTPLTIFDLQQGPTPVTNPAAGPVVNGITVEFLGNAGAVLASIPITPEATPGMWYNVPLATLTFTPTGAEIGQTVGLAIAVGQGANNEVADFGIEPIPTIVTGSTPEPGTFVLVGAGMVSLAYILRKKTTRNSSR